jgi:hypothetical protein
MKKVSLFVVHGMLALEKSIFDICNVKHKLRLYHLLLKNVILSNSHGKNIVTPPHRFSFIRPCEVRGGLTLFRGAFSWSYLSSIHKPSSPDETVCGIIGITCRYFFSP